MERKFKYSAITGSLNQVSDRFVPGGYKTVLTFEEIVENLAALKVLEGAELCYSTEGIESDAAAVKEILNKYNLAPSFVNSPLFGHKKWMYGSLSAADYAVRKEAIDVVFKLLDFTRDVGCDGINLWLGQDGFDYVFQTDYKKQWENLIESLRICSDYNPDIKLTLEPKLREPRNRSLIDTTPTALLMCMEADRKNVGVTIDLGHVLQAGQNMAQNVEIALKYDRLFNIHVNDNYGSWDDDMIVGSVHLMEYLELFYSLKKYGYDKWLSVDIFPYRERQFEAARECILYMEKFREKIDIMGVDKLSDIISTGDACAALKFIRETVL